MSKWKMYVMASFSIYVHIIESITDMQLIFIVSVESTERASKQYSFPWQIVEAAITKKGKPCICMCVQLIGY